jgi:hypothetical protein
MTLLESRVVRLLDHRIRQRDQKTLKIAVCELPKLGGLRYPVLVDSSGTPQHLATQERGYLNISKWSPNEFSAPIEVRLEAGQKSVLGWSYRHIEFSLEVERHDDDEHDLFKVSFAYNATENDVVTGVRITMYSQEDTYGDLKEKYEAEISLYRAAKYQLVGFDMISLGLKIDHEGEFAEGVYMDAAVNAYDERTLDNLLKNTIFDTRPHIAVGTVGAWTREQRAAYLLFSTDMGDRYRPDQQVFGYQETMKAIAEAQRRCMSKNDLHGLLPVVFVRR